MGERPRRRRRLVGFVNVLWDGLVHAWLQDVMVAAAVGRRGVGTALVGAAVATAPAPPAASGCTSTSTTTCATFYVGTCGFTPTNGGLIQL